MRVSNRKRSSASQEKSDVGPSSLAKSSERRPPIRVEEGAAMDTEYASRNRLVKATGMGHARNRLNIAMRLNTVTCNLQGAKDLVALQH